MSTLNETSSAQTDAARAAYTQWRKAVEEELKGAPFDKKLVTRTFEGIALQPVYTRLDAENLAHTNSLPGESPFLRTSRKKGYSDGTWEFAQEISAARPADFNAAILNDLNRGQNSVVVNLDCASRAGIDPDAAKDECIGGCGLSVADLNDLAAALNGVELSCIPVHLNAGVSPTALAAIYVAYAKRRGSDTKSLTGSLAADPLREWLGRGTLPASLDSLFDQIAGWTKWAKKNAPELKTVGVGADRVLEAGGNAVQELAYAVAAGVESIRALASRGIAPDVAAKRIVFTFAVGPQFFTEIAKFRAFRLLWTRAVSAFGIKPEKALPFVHARTAKWNKTVTDIHVNMLRVTTEALSAVLGGVDSLHVAPFDAVLGGQSDDFARRIARNVHTLLAEEFRFTSPADPSGGSWYIEKLTDELARKAWTSFQDIEKQGGIIAALRSGSFQKAVAASGAEKDDALSKRRLGMVGTNLFPNLKEKLLESRKVDPAVVAARKTEVAGRRPSSVALGGKTWEKAFDAALAAVEGGATVGQLTAKNAGAPEATIETMKCRRASAGFEALRLATEAYAKRTGSRPKVFVAKMGPVLQHKARADFTAGFFAVAGFEMLAKETFETAEAAAAAAVKSGAPVAVLCSTDDTYPALAPVFAKAIKAAKPDQTVVLAGYPAEHVEAFKAAGFDDFIHIRANVREMLANLLNKIGATL
ncbi:methylmalonyl-CoA mutase [Opitutaceae bacterium EW11]|nr:methylmalonyl-CoA mutase [Opitutaceae bacterium EW11]